MNGNTAFRVEEMQTEGDYAPQLLFPLEETGQRIQRVNEEEQSSWNVRVNNNVTTANSHSGARSVFPILIPSTRYEPKGNFRTLQQYEGVVLSIEKDAFWAKLVDKTTQGSENEQGEFPLDEVSDSDRRLVKPGAVFYWHIGYYDSPSGPRIRQSLILFRRLPAITEECLNEARRKAREFLEAFDRSEEKNPVDNG
jgi:hypothetical protein